MAGRVVGGEEGGRIMLASSRGADEGVDGGEIGVMRAADVFDYFWKFLLFAVGVGVDFYEVLWHNFLLLSDIDLYACALDVPFALYGLLLCVLRSSPWHEYGWIWTDLKKTNSEIGFIGGLTVFPQLLMLRSSEPETTPKYGSVTTHNSQSNFRFIIPRTQRAIS